ncbi:MAG: D-Ala-D-Ala carboxypeptidase family metallohydrolase [Desulfomonilaceae bacterium]
MAQHKKRQKALPAGSGESPTSDTVQQPRADWAHIRNFTPRDFTCRCEGLCGHPDVISPDLVAKLDKVQDLMGLPVTILCGTRCEKFNRKSGGRERSAHTVKAGVSHAADIHCPDASFRFAFLTAALPMFNRIGIGKDFVHVDDDPELPQNAVWIR